MVKSPRGEALQEVHAQNRNFPQEKLALSERKEIKPAARSQEMQQVPTLRYTQNLIRVFGEEKR